MLSRTHARRLLVDRAARVTASPTGRTGRCGSVRALDDASCNGATDASCNGATDAHAKPRHRRSRWGKGARCQPDIRRGAASGGNPSSSPTSSRFLLSISISISVPGSRARCLAMFGRSCTGSRWATAGGGKSGPGLKRSLPSHGRGMSRTRSR
jgi:hypothetical protein